MPKAEGGDEGGGGGELEGGGEEGEGVRGGEDLSFELQSPRPGPPII